MAPVQDAMRNNPDFEESQNENNRFLDKLQRAKAEHDRIIAVKKRLDKDS